MRFYSSLFALVGFLACSTVELPPLDAGQGGSSVASVSSSGRGGVTSSSNTGGNNDLDAGPCVNCMGYLAAWKAGENHSFANVCPDSYGALQGVKVCLCDSLGTCSMACAR